MLFPESKARQFIWQEDQKTPMRRVDSAAMNSQSVTNKIIDRLNGDTTFNLAGQISSNGGVIDKAWLYLVINALYRDNRLKKEDELPLILKATKELREGINYVTETDPAYLKRWDRKQTAAVVYAIYKTEKRDKKMMRRIEAYRETLRDNPGLLQRRGNPSTVTYSRKDFEKLDKIVERG